MAGLSALATIAGTVVSAAGMIAQGKAQKAKAEFEARQMEIKGQEERAAAQREAQEHERKKKFALSKLQARSSASGFLPTDPSTLDILGEITQYGTFQEQMARYGGESRAAGLYDSAAASRAIGQSAVQQSYFGAAGTILGGISNLASIYDPQPRAPAYTGWYL